MADSSGWRSISARMKRESPVFVMGVPRSGTSVLRRTLGNLRAFAGHGESPETRVFLHPQWILHILETRGERLFRYMLRDEAAARELLATVGNRVPKPTRLERATARLRKAPRFSRKGHVHLVRNYFHFAWRVRNEARILEKTPAHVLCIPDIRATFPRARMVLCVRHPVGVYSSFLKRLERERREGIPEDRAGRLQMSVERFVERYRTKATLAVDHHRANPGSSVLVRYEDLTSDTAGSLAEICRVIGEPMEPDALLDRAEQRDDAGGPRPQGRIVENRRSWEEWLDRNDARRVETALDPVMRRLGYEHLA